MKSSWFQSGEWNAICDLCGFKFKSSQLRLRWDGLMVCEEDWEPRHPQELTRPLPDQQKLPWTRPEPASEASGCSEDRGCDPDAPGGGCPIINTQAIPGYALVGCVIVGRDLGIRDTLAEVVGFH